MDEIFEINKNDNKLTGNFGESIATNFLKNKGYEIVERNFKNKIGEIDIICKYTRKDGEECFVFVEVKTRGSLKFGLPREAITFKKQQTIKNVAVSYLKYKKLLDKVYMRFDCLEIIGSINNDIKIEHIENAF